MNVKHVAVIAAVLAACSGPTSDAPAAERLTDTNGSTATALGVSAETGEAPTTPRASDPPSENDESSFSLEVFQADRAFWGQRAFVGALEHGVVRTAEEMAKNATAVIIGRVVGHVDGPAIQENDGEDAADMPEADSTFILQGAVIAVEELIAGELPVGGETIVLGGGYRTADQPSKEAETGSALMFLVWSGQGYEEGWAVAPPEVEAWNRAGYHLISSQGLYLPAKEGSHNPIAEVTEEGYDDDPERLVDAVVAELQDMTVNEIAEYVRTVRSS